MQENENALWIISNCKDLKINYGHWVISGENVFYLNASSIFPNDAELSDGFYEQPENKIIKAMVLAQKYKIVTLILKTR